MGRTGEQLLHRGERPQPSSQPEQGGTQRSPRGKSLPGALLGGAVEISKSTWEGRPLCRCSCEEGEVLLPQMLLLTHTWGPKSPSEKYLSCAVAPGALQGELQPLSHCCCCCCCRQAWKWDSLQRSQPHPVQDESPADWLEAGRACSGQPQESGSEAD